MSPEDFLEKTLHRDFPLLVEGREIFINRGLLAELSPAFKKLFFGDFKEALPGVTEAALLDKKLDDILELMKAVFWRWPWPVQNQPIYEENVDIIVRLADEYDINSLLKDCVNFLERNGSIAHWASLCFEYPHCLADTWPKLLSKIDKGNVVALVNMAEGNGGNGAELKRKCLQWLDHKIAGITNRCTASDLALELLVICNKLQLHGRMESLVPKIAKGASVEQIQEFYPQLSGGVIAAVLEAKLFANAGRHRGLFGPNNSEFSKSLLQK